MSRDKGIWLDGEKELFVNMQRVMDSNIAAAREGLQAGAMDIVNAAKENLRNNGNIATGQLRASGRVQAVQDDPDAVDAGFFSDGGGYAAYVEYGTRAGGRRTIKFLLPYIKQWMRKKGIGGNEKEFNNIAFFISRKIVRKGTRPHPFFAPAVEKNEKAVLKAIKQAIANNIRNGNK